MTEAEIIAFARDLWRYRDLTAMFVWLDFVAQYKQTYLFRRSARRSGFGFLASSALGNGNRAIGLWPLEIRFAQQAVPAVAVALWATCACGAIWFAVCFSHSRENPSC